MCACHVSELAEELRHSVAVDIRILRRTLECMPGAWAHLSTSQGTREMMSNVSPQDRGITIVWIARFETKSRPDGSGAVYNVVFAGWLVGVFSIASIH